jgi:predicted O-methyltransferase YrrM
MTIMHQGYVRDRLYSAPEAIKAKRKWSALVQEDSQVAALRKAVDNADWGKFHEEKKTRNFASAAWAASEDRCEQLRSLCMSTGAKRVLEIGSFVGLSSLSMAQVLPDNGELVTLEIDPFAVDFGLDIKVEADGFWKMDHMVGPAWDSLQNLIAKKEDAGGEWKPFDLAVIDADKAGMMEYFKILTEVPGLMSDNYVICVDVKPFKGQPSTQRPEKRDSWLISSGQSEIDAFRKFITRSGDFYFREHCGLLQVCKNFSYTMASSPFAAFPNCYGDASRDAHWVAPQVADPVAELRKTVSNTDWASLFAEGRTQFLTAASWSASDDRCEKLQALCVSSGAQRVLEIGSFCGVASLAMAEALPENASIISLEIDPFLVEYCQEIKGNCKSSSKIRHMVGPALTSLKALAEQATAADELCKPFDFVVIDADKAGMLDYFKLVLETPGMLTQDVTVCVDVAPFKCQQFLPYVKGKLDDWVVKSGREAIDAFVSFVKCLPDIDVDTKDGLVIVRKRK